MGSLDAQSTTAMQMAFKFLLYDVPLAVVVFFAWSVGESYTRERWGELAGFVRRHPSPRSAQRHRRPLRLQWRSLRAGHRRCRIPHRRDPARVHLAHPSTGIGTAVIVQLGGPFLLLLFAAFDAVIFPITSLFFLSWTNRHRVLWIGMIAAIAFGVIGGVCDVPIDPLLRGVALRIRRHRIDRR